MGWGAETALSYLEQLEQERPPGETGAGPCGTEPRRLQDVPGVDLAVAQGGNSQMEASGDSMASEVGGPALFHTGLPQHWLELPLVLGSRIQSWGPKGPSSGTQVGGWPDWILAPRVTGAVVLNRILLGRVSGSIPAVLLITTVTSPLSVVTLLLAGASVRQLGLVLLTRCPRWQMSVMSKGLLILLAKSSDLGMISWAPHLLPVARASPKVPWEPSHLKPG